MKGLCEVFRVNLKISCCSNTVLIVRLGLGTENIWLGLGKGQVWFKIPVFGHRRQGWRLESQPDMWPLSCNSITNPSSLWYDSRWKKKDKRDVTPTVEMSLRQVSDTYKCECNSGFILATGL